MRWIVSASLLIALHGTATAWPRTPQELALQEARYQYRDSEGQEIKVMWPIRPGFEEVPHETPVENQPIEAMVKDTAERYGLDPQFVHAVILAESNYDPTAVSPKGAIGLMQLMPATAERFGVDPWTPEQNIDGGVRYLKWLLEEFGSMPLALAAYNAGEGAVMRYGNQIPPYEETRNYVDKVMRFYLVRK